MVLISGWFYYPAGLFSKKSKFATKSGHIKRLVPLSAVTLNGVHCTKVVNPIIKMENFWPLRDGHKGRVGGRDGHRGGWWGVPPS